MRVAITGANGQLGRLLTRQLQAGHEVVPIVRRRRAEAKLRAAVGEEFGKRIKRCQPWNAESLSEAVADCDVLVHLVGTIRETAKNRFEDTHEAAAATAIAAAAAAGCERVIYISIVGAAEPGRSEVLTRRLAVERQLFAGFTHATIIRVPMVLGGDDRASRALLRQAMRSRAYVLRAGSLEQPIYAGDVVAAVANAIESPVSGHRAIDLAGPDVISRGALIQRVATLCNNEVAITSLPLGIVLAAARLMECFRRPAALQSEMLRILDHDDDIDANAGAAILGLQLTPLDEFLPLIVERAAATHEATA